MARLLLNLRGVPEDEADEIRELLERQALPYYETPPNRWGISAGAIWLAADEDAPRARALLAEYQEERVRRAREAGPGPGFTGLLRADPAGMLLRLAAAALVLSLTLLPFLGLAL